MSAAGLLAPAPAPAGAPPAPEYYPEEDEELESAEDDERSCRGRESDEDTEDASETDLAKHDEEDYVEMKEQMYQDKLASLKRQLQQLQEGTLQEYQKRMKKLDQQYKERIRNAELFLQLETEQVERNYIKEKKAAVKEFEDKKVELKENLIAELEEKKKMIENEKLTMELTGDSMEVKPIMTRKLRRRPNDPVPIPDKRRKPAPAQLNYLLTDEQIMEDLRTLNKLKSPKRPASPSSPEHLPAAPAESPAQRFEARIEDGKLYYDKRWYHKSQAIYLESKDNQKLSCVISSVGANEVGAELPPPPGERSVTNLQCRCHQERTVEPCVLCGLGSQSALPGRNCTETKYPGNPLLVLTNNLMWICIFLVVVVNSTYSSSVGND